MRVGVRSKTTVPKLSRHVVVRSRRTESRIEMGGSGREKAGMVGDAVGRIPKAICACVRVRRRA